MTKGNTVLEKIAREIITHFRQGLRAGDDILAFAGNVVGAADIHETAKLICAEDGYGQGVAEMVFFPDPAIRLIVEPLLPAEGLSREDIAAIRKLAASSVKSVIVSLADERRSMTVDVPLCEILLNNYMRRLNLAGKVPVPLSLHPEDAGQAARYMAARVRIRNSRYILSPRQERHIADLVRYLAQPERCKDTDFLPAIDFLLRVMSEKNQESDLREILYEYKKTWLHILMQIRHFDEMNRSYSMDFLMSQRISPPAAGHDEALRNIELADMVSTVLYGTALPSPAGEDSRIIEIGKIDAESLKKIMDTR